MSDVPKTNAPRHSFGPLLSLIGPADEDVLSDVRLALPDPQEARTRLEEVAQAVLAGAVPGVVSEVAVLPAGNAFSLWREAGSVPTLVISHPDIPSEVQVRWLPRSPLAVAVARAGRPVPGNLVHGGESLPWPADRPPQLPALEVRVVEPSGFHSTGHDSGGLMYSGGGCALMSVVSITVDPLAVVPAVATWHRGATAILAAGPPHSSPPARRATAPPVDVQVTWDTRDPRVDPVARGADLPALVRWAPRDRRGRLDRKVPVLVAPVSPGTAELGRSEWIVARAVDWSTLALRIEPLIAANQWHRLDVTPWLWRRDATEAPTGWDAQGGGAQLALLDAGSVIEAIEAGGVLLDVGARRLLSGRRLGWRSAGYDDDWPRVARHEIAHCAPWRLAGVAADFVRATCRPKSDGARVVLLPHQPWQSKAGLSLLPTRPAMLAVRWTSSNRVLPRSLWRRAPTRQELKADS